MKEWRVKKGQDARIRSRHPWVFSNELINSPKGIAGGEPILLRDYRGDFLAMGYGNPQSLISFRALSFNQKDLDKKYDQLVTERLCSAWYRRWLSGFTKSFRLCFSENDFLPGLIVDRYLSGSSQILVLQISTAGMEVFAGEWENIFKKMVEWTQAQKYSAIGWENTAVLVRRDASIRKLEGLDIENTAIVKSVDGLDYKNIPIELSGAAGEILIFDCDLLEGQKTGFFLDQTFNIGLVNHFLNKSQFLKKKIRILDLCCYLGHWSAQLVTQLKVLNIEAEVTLVDVSADALARARKNVERLGVTVRHIEADVLEPIAKLENEKFDIVVSDPPAFIKNRKDIPTGKHAYLKMNTQAIKWLESSGLLVACSCSGLLTEEDLLETLGKAARRNGRDLQNLVRGGHGPDHPTLAWFPEGKYLKMILSRG